MSTATRRAARGKVAARAVGPQARMARRAAGMTGWLAGLGRRAIGAALGVTVWAAVWAGVDAARGGVAADGGAAGPGSPAVETTGGAGPAQTRVVPRVTPRWPRDFGYRVGDLLEVAAVVRLPAGYELDPASLREGELPEWLELREAGWRREASGGSVVYHLRFVYQVFYAPLRVTVLEIPARQVRWWEPSTGAVAQASVPPFRFTIAPVADPQARLEPDWRMPAPSARPVVLSAASLAVLSGVWAGWAAIERRRRSRGVFASAHRQLKHTRDCTQALVILHRALEQAAGQALFSHNLEALLARWPPAGGVREELGAFFRLSDAVFYRNHAHPFASVPPDCLKRVRELSGRLAALERRFGEAAARRTAGR